MTNKTTSNNIGKIMFLLFIGAIIGMIFSWICIFGVILTFTNNILPKIQIENVIFDFNETELVNQFNKTYNIGELKEDRCFIINKVINKYWDVRTNIIIYESSYIENKTEIDCEEIK